MRDEDISAEADASKVSHDFEALRAKRNQEMTEFVRKFCEKAGVPVEEIRTAFNPNACFCACGTGGPCEHCWDGEPWESEDGLAWSTMCSRCGCLSMSHDIQPRERSSNER